jgi:hypothetical protein
MLKKLLILSLCISVLFVFSAPITPVDAGGKWKKSKKINWEIAGTIVQSIAIYNPQGGALIGNHSLINLSAQGSPGPANITLLSKPTIPPEVTGTSLTCESGYLHIADFEKNDFVAVFPDQSLLFASIASEGGILCVGNTAQTAGTTYFIVEMNITGGKGRFEGAEGSFTAEGYGYPGFSTGGTLVGENGTVTGTIEFSD